jgi:hypothetical protein
LRFTWYELGVLQWVIQKARVSLEQNKELPKLLAEYTFRVEQRYILGSIFFGFA